MINEQNRIITRREHMDTIPRDAETPESLAAARAAHHRAYYSQFVTPAIKGRVLLYIKLPELLASECEHFNDISLSRWDAIVKSRLPVANMMEKCGDNLTLGNGVCIAKEAARQIIEYEKGKVCC